MKYVSIFSAAGLMVVALPALAVAQTTPQTPPSHPAPQTQPQQTMPRTQPQRTSPQQMPPRNTPMRSDTPMRQGGNGAAQKEIAKAHAHALMAQGAKTLEKAHTHLHHVVNCLVGPHGNGFDATTGNPCAGMGQGALSDSSGNSSAHMRVNKALDMARKGLAANDLSTVQNDASRAAHLLQAETGMHHDMPGGTH